MTWFSAVELQITLLLAIATNAQSEKDIAAFEILTRGMDARVKCHRLREASGLHKTIGPKLDARICHFVEKLVKRRNQIAHSLIVMANGDKEMHFTNLARMPFRALGHDQIGKLPIMVSTEQFFFEAFWLRAFSLDLSRVSETQAQSKILEIESPVSPVPK